MRLEDQVVNLDLSKRLKELGVKVESYFHWLELPWKPGAHILRHFDEFRDAENYSTYPTYTVAELGEMLPYKIETINDRYEFWERKKYEWFKVTYKASQHQYHPLVGFEDKNEANARAHLLIYLLENKLIEQPGKGGGE
jgi:hypothetical protein